VYTWCSPHSFGWFPVPLANARPNSFGDALFFSVETLATVGYGEMYPVTIYGRVVAAIEIVCGFGFTAILTGLTFVRFSRPRAKLVFAANPVVAMYDGKPTLMVRIGNARAAALMDGAAKLNLYFITHRSGRHSGRRFAADGGAGARCRQPSGAGLDRAGRGTGVAASARAMAIAPTGFSPVAGPLSRNPR
jgi:hypothetical protein